MQVLVVAGRLDGVDEFLGFDELVTRPLQVIRLGHDGAGRGQSQAGGAGV